MSESESAITESQEAPAATEKEDITYQAVEKDGEKIAVEIKTQVGKSLITEFYSALGKYQLYEVAIEEAVIDRVLFLAMPDLIYQRAWKHSLIRGSIKKYGIKIIIIDLDTEKVTQWIK